MMMMMMMITIINHKHDILKDIITLLKVTNSTSVSYLYNTVNTFIFLSPSNKNTHIEFY